MRRRRKLWIVLLATPFVLLAIDTLYWWIAVKNLEQGFGIWQAEAQAVGWRGQHEPPVRGGWPMAATLSIPAISLVGDSPDVPGRLAWSAERLTLRVALSRPGQLEIEPAGRQRLRVAGTEVPITAARMRLAVPLWSEPLPDQVDLIATNLHANTPIGGDASVGSVNVHLEFRPEAQNGDPILEFSLKAEGVGLPSGIVRPLGPRIAVLEVDGALNGPAPVGRTPADQAAAWRDGGGSLKIEHLAVVWGPLDLAVSATLALDDQLQPMGSGKARLVGYAETLDALAAHAAISRSAAIAAKAVLSLLAHNPEDGSPPDVEVPLTLQYRTLSMSHVPLVRLPEVDWP